MTAHSDHYTNKLDKFPRGPKKKRTQCQSSYPLVIFLSEPFFNETHLYV